MSNETETERAEIELENAASGLDRLMTVARDLKNETFQARQDVADRYRDWLKVGPRAITLDELKREYVAHEQAERAGRANGTIPPAKVEHRVLMNPIDAKGFQDSTAEGFVRSQMKTGARRGAFSSAQRGGRIVPVLDERGQIVGRKLVMPG